MKLHAFTRLLHSKRSLPALGSELAHEMQTLAQEKVAPFSCAVIIDADAPSSLIDHVTSLFAAVPDYVHMRVSYSAPSFDADGGAECGAGGGERSSAAACGAGGGERSNAAACGNAPAGTGTFARSVHAVLAHASVPEFDFCLVICGFSASSAYAYQRAYESGIPCALLSLTPRLCAELAQFAQVDVPPEDIMAPAALPEHVHVHVIEQRLAQWLMAVLPEKKLSLCNAFSFVRGVAARSEVRSCAVQNSAIGLVHLIPGADLPLMTLNQMKMLLRIASIYGHEPDVLQLAQGLGVGAFAFVSRAGARSALRALPAFAQLIRASVALGSTCTMGWALIAYYEHADVPSQTTPALPQENEHL